MSYLLVSIAVLGLIGLGLLGVIIAAQRGQRREAVTDYRAFFIVGLIWLPLGVILALALGGAEFWALAVIGLAFLIVGIVDRDKWKKPGGDAAEFPPDPPDRDAPEFRTFFPINWAYVVMGVLIGMALTIFLAGLFYWLSLAR
jgi:hypothetical protein